MGHNLVVSFQFPQLIMNPSGHLRNKRSSKFYEKKTKQSFMCFAVNNNHHQNQNPPIFSLRFSSFHPLSESPEASFDDYLEDEARLLRATFSGKSEKLNEDEWRVQMPSFQLLFFKVSPVADVRLNCRSSAQDYPIHIPHNISKFLDLQLMRWELKGMGTDFKPQRFTISVKGALYAERTESKSVLTNNLLLNLHNFAAPTPLDFFAQDFLQPFAEKGLKGMMEQTMQEFTENLLLDYGKYKKEKQANVVPTNYG